MEDGKPADGAFEGAFALGKGSGPDCCSPAGAGGVPCADVPVPGVAEEDRPSARIRAPNALCTPFAEALAEAFPAALVAPPDEAP